MFTLCNCNSPACTYKGKNVRKKLIPNDYRYSLDKSSISCVLILNKYALRSTNLFSHVSNHTAFIRNRLFTSEHLHWYIVQMDDTDLRTQHNSFTNSVRPFPCIYVCVISRALLENIYENITYTFINPVMCKKTSICMEDLLSGIFMFLDLCLK